MTNVMNRHAVVIGAGLGGLFAARTLAGLFERVTVLERDPLPSAAMRRRGVPQGAHVHGFQSRGVEVLDELFPGLTDELTAAGATHISDLRDLHFRIGGHLLSRRSNPIAPVLLATRPYLEHSVRTRVAALPGVTLRDRTEVVEPLWSADGSAVTGVRNAASGGGATEDLAADLVVDATGRGSRTPVWLEARGYDRPSTDRIAVRVRYASQTVRLPAGRYPMRFVGEGRSPGRDLGVLLFGCEDDTWVLSVVGSARAFGEVDRAWMLRVADDVLPRWAAEALYEAEPLGPIATHQHPASVRRRYDRMNRFPDGLAVTGDAMCAFNPVYGQGMSVAAEEALLLRDAVTTGLHGAGMRFHRAAARTVGTAWQSAAGADLSDPEVEGNPSRAMRLGNRYTNAVLAAAEYDPEVASRFLAVVGLVAPPTSLFAPRVLRAVARTRPPMEAPERVEAKV